MSGPEGRVALVTGASSGIGRDLAVELARRGFRVALSARRVEALENVARDIRELGGLSSVFPADLSSPGEAVKLVGRVVADMGSVDVLVNNAGYAVYGPIEETDPGEIERIYTVNSVAPAILSREAAAVMKARGGGCIVNVITMAVYTPTPWLSLYTSSKAALKALTDSLRIELRPFSIRVIGVYPGYVETEFHRKVVVTRTAARARGWSVPRSRAVVLSSERVARSIADKIADESFNGDLVVGAIYSLARALAQHAPSLVGLFMRRGYERAVRALQGPEDPGSR